MWCPPLQEYPSTSCFFPLQPVSPKCLSKFLIAHLSLSLHRIRADIRWLGIDSTPQQLYRAVCTCIHPPSHCILIQPSGDSTVFSSSGPLSFFLQVFPSRMLAPLFVTLKNSVVLSMSANLSVLVPVSVPVPVSSVPVPVLSVPVTVPVQVPVGVPVSVPVTVTVPVQVPVPV